MLHIGGCPYIMWLLGFLCAGLLFNFLEVFMKKIIFLFFVLFLSACDSGISSGSSVLGIEGKYEQSPAFPEKFVFKSNGFMSVEQLGKVVPGKENVPYKVEGNKIHLGAPLEKMGFLKNADGTLNFVYSANFEHALALLHKAN